MSSSSVSPDFDENNEVFQRGLQDIIKTYQTQLGRQLTAQELVTIKTQARDFFLKQQHTILNPPRDDHRSLNHSTTDPQSPPHQCSSLSSPIDTPTTDLQTQKIPSESPPPYPSNFPEIAQLIASGQPLTGKVLPGLKTIPNQLNDQEPSQAKLATIPQAGRKPWES